MKIRHVSILSLFILSILLLRNSYAQDYARWNLPEGAKLRLGKGNVGRLTFSSDGNQLIVNSSIGLWIYDAHTGRELKFIPERSEEIYTVSPDSRMYVCIGSDGTVRVRDLTDGSARVTLKENITNIRRIVFSPDSSKLATGIDKEIILWDLTSGEQIAKFNGHTHSITSIDFSPDDSTLASGSWDETVRLWDIPTATHKATLTTRPNATKNSVYGISNVLFSPDGKLLASASFNERKLHLWDATTGDHKAVFDTSGVEDMDFSADGKTIAVASSRYHIHFWDIATGTPKTELTGHRSWIWSLKFSPDGNTLASGGYDELHLWDATTGAHKLAISGHTGWVRGVAFTPDGKTLAAGGRYDIRLWDAINGQHKAILYENDTFSDNKSLAFSPDGNTLASEIGWSIRLWNVAERAHIAKLKAYLGSRASGYGIASIAFTTDGKYLASGSSDSTIQIWYLGRTYKGQLVGHRGGIWSIAFSNDNRTLISGSSDRTVRLWDVESGTHLTTFIGHTGAVKCVAISPDGNLVASGSNDTTVILWDVATAEPITILRGHPYWLSSVAFSPDGRTLASACSGETVVRLWDVPTGTPKKVLTGHTRYVYNLTFSPDGNTLASGSSDGTVYLWNMIPDTTQLAEDANRDGIVDIKDVIFVASHFGQSGADMTADVNADGIVDITDILLVAGAIADKNGAPNKDPQSVVLLNTSDVQKWLEQAQFINTKTPTIRKGIAVLEQVLDMSNPKQSTLLPNYPNPFNPETWIPFQLAKPADVILRIYSSNGQLVRTLNVGYRNIGIYQSHNRAIYWDGKNHFGEPASSGTYYYTISAGEFKTTRKLVIRK